MQYSSPQFYSPHMSRQGHTLSNMPLGGMFGDRHGVTVGAGSPFHDIGGGTYTQVAT